MSNIHKFKCVLDKQIWPENKTVSPNGWYFASVITKNKLPHTQCLNDSYEDKKSKDDPLYLVYIKGDMPKLERGIDYTITAKLTHIRKTNDYAYLVHKIEYKMPESLEEQQKFLRTIVTKTQAKNILSVYPDFVSRIIHKETVSHKDLHNIGAFILDRIATRIVNTYALSELYRMLERLNITERKIKKLMEGKTAKELVDAINENPYMLTEIKGLGFYAADDIIQKLFPKSSKSRIRVEAFIKDFLSRVAYEAGDTLVDIELLLNGMSSDKGIKYQGLMQIMPECLDIFNEIMEEQRNDT